jgi:hypothetical protein
LAARSPQEARRWTVVGPFRANQPFRERNTESGEELVFELLNRAQCRNLGGWGHLLERDTDHYWVLRRQSLGGPTCEHQQKLVVDWEPFRTEDDNGNYLDLPALHVDF